MKISKDFDGLRFIGVCHHDRGFEPTEIRCTRCGWPIDPRAQGNEVALRCSSCGAIPVTFWSQAELHVFLAENWNALRQACSHPSVRSMLGS